MDHDVNSNLADILTDLSIPPGMAGAHWRLPSERRQQLVAELERTIIDRRAMRAYFGYFRGRLGLGRMGQFEFADEELALVLERGLTALGERVDLLALDGPSLLGLRAAVFADLSPFWSGRLEEVAASWGLPVRAEEFIERASSSSGASSDVGVPEDQLAAPLSAGTTPKTSDPGQVPLPDFWVVLVPPEAISLEGDGKPLLKGSLSVEFTFFQEGPPYQLEVQLDPLRLTPDVICEGRILTPQDEEVAHATANDRRLTFFLQVPSLGDCVLACDFRKGQQRLRFRVVVRPPMA